MKLRPKIKTYLFNMTDIKTKVYICGGYRIILTGSFNLWTENWLVKSAEITLFVKWTTKLVGVWM